MKITDIFWERANLTLTFDKKIDGDVYLVSDNKKIKLNYKDNKVSFNITSIPEGEPLYDGSYNIKINNELAILDDEVLKVLWDKSRNFHFGRGTELCIIDFNIDESRTFMMNVEYFIKNFKFSNETFWERFVRVFKKTFRPLMIFCMNLYYWFFRLFKLGKKNVLFLTENSDKLDGNLKVLYEKYIELNEYKVRKFTKDFFHINNWGTRIIHFARVIYKAAKSDIIIVDNYSPTLSFVNFSRKTRYVQLWHAGIGFKSVGYARFGLDGSPNPFRSSHRRYTDAIVDQEKLIDVYKEVYGVKRSIFKSYGMPKLDGYLDKERIDNTIDELYKEYPILKDKKIILFSPTYRGPGSRFAYYDYSLIDLKKIYDYCEKNNFLFVVKMHPFIKKKIEINKEYKDRIIDLSELDINSLIYITDIMITDYSSCAYEYSLFDRPLVFYRFDKAFYEFTRPMHTVDEFTSKQYEVQTFDELMNVLNKLDNVKIEDRFKTIKKKNNSNSCEKIIKLLQ